MVSAAEMAISHQFAYAALAQARKSPFGCAFGRLWNYESGEAERVLALPMRHRRRARLRIFV